MANDQYVDEMWWWIKKSSSCRMKIVVCGRAYQQQRYIVTDGEGTRTWNPTPERTIARISVQVIVSWFAGKVKTCPLFPYALRGGPITLAQGNLALAILHYKAEHVYKMDFLYTDSINTKKTGKWPRVPVKHIPRMVWKATPDDPM